MPILEIGEVPGTPQYWDKIEEVKAHVEPLPLVPATWIILNLSKSDGCMRGNQIYIVSRAAEDNWGYGSTL